MRSHQFGDHTLFLFLFNESYSTIRAITLIGNQLIQYRENHLEPLLGLSAQLVHLTLEFSVIDYKVPDLDKGPHNENADLNGPLRIKYACRHNSAVLRKGIWQRRRIFEF